MNTMKSLFGVCATILVAICLGPAPLFAQNLENELKSIATSELAAQAKSTGDPQRGAVVFFQHHLACSKCHAVGASSDSGLGPNLTTLGDITAGNKVSDEALVEAVLTPSKSIRKGFESVTIALADGTTISALLVEKTADKLVVRDVGRGGAKRELAAAEIEAVKPNETSIMPAGQVNQLNSRQQFLDLIRYLMDIRDGGAKRAAELQPPQSLLTFTVPEYEAHLDHAALISDWNEAAFQRGAATYQRVCANCHGTPDKPGSLPTSLRFAEGKFKNGSDPLSMYRTLTHGFGLMAPQTWMVPSQKYDVIHYIRETYLKPRNPSQFVAVDRAYLSRLPKGDTRGPEPSKLVAWSAMDYGPSLAHTYELPGLAHNFAYKGVAVRLDPGAGGVARGRHWLMFDTDTLRVAGAWNAAGYAKESNADDNFIDWRGIQFNGEHGVHPRIVGQTVLANGTGPGWANPATGEIRDDARVQGRDGKRYGPLPKQWGAYRGQYHYGQQVVFSYTIGTTEILESPGLFVRDGNASPLVLRTFNIGPRERDLVLQVAEHPAEEARLSLVPNSGKSTVLLAVPEQAAEKTAEAFAFDGSSYLEIAKGEAFDLVGQDYSIVARVKTKSDGTIWSLTQPGPKWIPNGQSLFIRGGRLTFDIGWVGAVSGKSKIDDGAWHSVALTWQKLDGRVRLYVDGKLDGEGKLAAKAALPKSVARIGYTAPDFPRPAPFFTGEISEVCLYQERLPEQSVTIETLGGIEKSLRGRWLANGVANGLAKDSSGHNRDAEVRRGSQPPASTAGPIVAGFSPRNTQSEWIANKGKLQLRLPAGKEPLQFTVWVPADCATIPNANATKYAEQFADLTLVDPATDLKPLTQGGPPRWPQKLTTTTLAGAASGPFATDILTAPESNPWLAQMRFTGLDLCADGKIAVCTWDGDVWLVEDQIEKLAWQRIASGLFQPLGLKIVGGKIHLTCRDQLVVLHDLNGDSETDYYQCLNNDHQVTEHFHEFAMGLQTDAAGNFYYAKSGCHGKAAVVPHHGTLLKVTADGSRTDILATGFRAANGVCLNPDGSFVVTDQEGFWNPKNRINWVEVNSGKPNFYGNMLGYHDITDSSDAAMTPPLCWITNTFDRSPAELLWVDSQQWGPLNGSLLNLSYGNGKVFVVPHERVGGQMQGGMIALPIPAFPTGVMRGRFHPRDGQLYLCGMFAWAGNATSPGGFYRLRATGQLMHLPTKLSATKNGIDLTFTAPLDPKTLSAKDIRIKTWSLKRTANYGSKHHDEHPLEVRSAQLSKDGKTLHLDIKDLQPTWCMEIDYTLTTADGKAVHGVLHNTIHALK